MSWRRGALLLLLHTLPWLQDPKAQGSLHALPSPPNSSDLISHPYPVPALVFQTVSSLPASGPLHWLLALPGALFPQVSMQCLITSQVFAQTLAS